MLLANLMVAARKLRPLKVPMLVVALSATLALLFTLATGSSEPDRPQAAGEAQMRLMAEEHGLVAELVDGLHAAVQAERAEAARHRAETRAMASADTTPPTPAKVAKAGAAVHLAAVPTPKRNPNAAPEPPLQLQAAVAAPQPTSRRPVVEQARAVLATVEQIPRWVRVGVANVADWAIVAPAKTITKLPERRFL
jgi:hypothetical protein